VARPTEVDRRREVDDAVGNGDLLDGGRAARVGELVRTVRSVLVGRVARRGVEDDLPTVWPPPVPRRSGNVAVWSALTTALRMNWVDEPESAGVAGARTRATAAIDPIAADAIRAAPRRDRDTRYLREGP
jgi:hypothetical protein